MSSKIGLGTTSSYIMVWFNDETKERETDMKIWRDDFKHRNILNRADTLDIIYLC